VLATCAVVYSTDREPLNPEDSEPERSEGISRNFQCGSILFNLVRSSAVTRDRMGCVCVFSTSGFCQFCYLFACQHLARLDYSNGAVKGLMAKRNLHLIQESRRGSDRRGEGHRLVVTP
jgi:hypothetical protein